MKKYLLGLLILGATVALATTVYADWAEVSESSTRDVEWAGEIKADQLRAKQASDLKLRQLSEQAENLTTTVIGAATVSATASAATLSDNSNSSADSAAQSQLSSATKDLVADADTGGSSIGSLGDSGTGDSPPADNPMVDNPLIDPREALPEDIVPSEPFMPKDPDPIIDTPETMIRIDLGVVN